VPRVRIIVAIVVALLSFGMAARAQPSQGSANDADGFEALMHRSFDERQHMAVTLLGVALGSMAGGVPMLVPSEPDQAFRVGGVTTMLFGAANLGFAAAALVTLAADRERFDSPGAARARRTPAGLATARLDAVIEAEQDATIYGVNLGLDVLYLSGGILGIVGSQAHFDDHPNRWLAAGIAITAQALFLGSYDATGVALNGARHAALLRALAPTPTISPNPAGGVDVAIGLAGGF
jgi:hypothetical protein